MVSEEVIKKLILGTEDDRALANEYIKHNKLCVVPDEFKRSIWDLSGKYFTYELEDSIYLRDTSDNTWTKLVITGTTTTTKVTKIK